MTAGKSTAPLPMLTEPPPAKDTERVAMAPPPRPPRPPSMLVPMVAGVAEVVLAVDSALLATSPTVGTAVAIEMSGDTVIRAGIALTGVGGATIGCTDAAAALTGQPLTADRIAEAADLAASAAQPKTDHRGTAEYKRQLVRVFVSRILGGSLSSTTAAAERAA